MEVKTKRKSRVIKKRDKRTIVLMNPQREKFLALYRDPKSPTYNNAYRSGLAVGFSDNYSKNILFMNSKWLLEFIDVFNDERTLLKAESNLREVQNMDVTNGGDKIDPSILALRLKNDHFLAERLNKAKYSTRTENATLIKVEHTIDEETKKRLDALL
jgi:hypothetical protein